MEIAAWELLALGLIIVLSLLSKAVLEWIGLPDLLGYLLIGLGLGGLDSMGPYVLPLDAQLLTFLAQIGVVALLFRIGLECEIEHLWNRLSGATRIWLVNVTATMVIILGTALFLLGWPLLPSLFVSVALTATGIGVSVRVWRNSEQLGSAKGALMLDVAELDDILGVVLLALLTALAPKLQSGWSADLIAPTVFTLGSTIGKMGLLTLGGLLFARYVERRLTHGLGQLQSQPDTMISVLGVGLVVAGFTALLGFSAAIGGFFAGLLFSNDPVSVKIDASFDSIHDLFVPFFFIFIGFTVDLPILTNALVPLVLLFAAAVVSKGLGSFIPVAQRLRPASALVFAVALIPRSEITLIVMERGLDLGVVSPEMFGVVVAVAALTMVTVPLALRLLFLRKQAA